MAYPRTFSVTNLFVNKWLNFFNKEETNGDSLEDYCRAEYKDDWQWALNFYSKNNSFPSVHKIITK
jgi:hypothetical protein